MLDEDAVKRWKRLHPALLDHPARKYLCGYEKAPIGFLFDAKPVDPAFLTAIENAIAALRKANPDITILLKW